MVPKRSRDGKSERGTTEGKALEVVEMIKIRKMEVLCAHETKWKGDRTREMAEGYKMLHAGGDGMSNAWFWYHRECGDQQGSGTSGEIR